MTSIRSVVLYDRDSHTWIGGHLITLKESFLDCGQQLGHCQYQNQDCLYVMIRGEHLDDGRRS